MHAWWRIGLVVVTGFLCSCVSRRPPMMPVHSGTATVLAKGEEVRLSNPVQLTTGFAKAGEAYFSPDTQWIIFQASKKGTDHYQMYVAPLVWDQNRIVGLGTVTRISPEPSRNTCGFFSPDGRSLIFASTAGREEAGEPEAGYQREGGNYRWAYPKGMEIYLADDWQAAASKGWKPDSPGSKDGFVDLARRRLTDNDAYDAEGAYSPDGKWIVFTSNRTGDLELYAMRPDGSGVVQLTHTKGYDGGAFFSPDGKRLVYRSDRKGNDLLQIFVADVDYDAAGNVRGLKGERQLTDDANVNWGPFWHPDGRHIIYATSAHGHQNYELYLMRDDGSAKRRVTYWNGFDGLPAFSPDGRCLMWSSKRTPDGTTQVFVARFTLGAED